MTTYIEEQTALAYDRMTDAETFHWSRGELAKLTDTDLLARYANALYIKHYGNAEDMKKFMTTRAAWCYIIAEERGISIPRYAEEA